MKLNEAKVSPGAGGATQGGGGGVIENVPGQGLSGVGHVSNIMKYSSPAVNVTLTFFEDAEEVTFPTHIPPEVGHPSKTKIPVHVCPAIAIL
jgi:hypothetical protein